MSKSNPHLKNFEPEPVLVNRIKQLFPNPKNQNPKVFTYPKNPKTFKPVKPYLKTTHRIKPRNKEIIFIIEEFPKFLRTKPIPNIDCSVGTFWEVRTQKMQSSADQTYHKPHDFEHSQIFCIGNFFSMKWFSNLYSIDRISKVGKGI